MANIIEADLCWALCCFILFIQAEAFVQVPIELGREISFVTVSARKQKHHNQDPASKKLRTASDVLSRLKWDNNFLGKDLLVGLEDRVDGPIEIPVQDHSSGGDIPEHRILYFRNNDASVTLNDQILWDRVGRVDRIFGSGNGKTAQVAAETTLKVEQAIAKVIQIEEAKQSSREAKVKKCKLSPECDSHSRSDNARRPDSSNRFSWIRVPWFVYSSSDSCWAIVSEGQTKAGTNQQQKSKREVTVVTWNILFNLFDTEELPQDRMARWELLLSELETSSADVIIMQEVTTPFLDLLSSQLWVRQHFAISATPSFSSSVHPSGVLLMWRSSVLRPLSSELDLFQCMDYGRSRAMTVVLRLGSSTAVAVAAAHLPADRVDNGQDTSAKLSRALARKRELSAILVQFERIGAKIAFSGHDDVLKYASIVAGDFNAEDDELLHCSFASECATDNLYRDAWSTRSQGEGWTFDPTLNPRALRSSSLVNDKMFPRRIDRIYYWGSVLKRLESCLLGKSIAAPSDHFGVKASFGVTNERQELRIPSIWAQHAPPSTDYALVASLVNSKLQALKYEHDPLSRLPTLHVTLIPAFVEADHGCLDLVTQGVEEAIMTTQNLVTNEITLNEVSVCRRQGLASLVGVPDDKSTVWLEALHDNLLRTFRSCDLQEGSWAARVTLATTVSSRAARDLLTKSFSDVATEPLTVRSIDVMKLDTSGTFQELCSFPIRK